MAIVSLGFILVAVGYILGVWTALAVARQPQREYEEGSESRVWDWATLRTTNGAPARVTDDKSARVVVSQVADRY